MQNLLRIILCKTEVSYLRHLDRRKKPNTFTPGTLSIKRKNRFVKLQSLKQLINSEVYSIFA